MPRRPDSSLQPASRIRADYTNFFLTLWNHYGGPPLVQEYRFHPSRNFRFDFAYPPAKVAIEIDGGTWLRVGHVHPARFAKDLEKFNLAVLLGWRVFRFTPDTLTNHPDVLIPIVELCR